jgi:hypothetical protein
MGSRCCVSVGPPIVTRQRLGKYVPAATNTRATGEELLDAVFSMPSVSYHHVVKGKWTISSSQNFLFIIQIPDQLYLPELLHI